MSKYNALERQIAKVLESQPWLRNAIRNAYKRLVYIRQKKNYTLQLNGQYALRDVANYIGLEKYDSFFFGYYDKSPWDETCTKYLAHTLLNNKCFITICNFEKKSYEHIAETKAWNYQQGAMTQWVDNNTVIFNVYYKKSLGAVLYSLNSKQQHFIEYPVQVFNKMDNEYLTINYRRLSWLRPDYGYFYECDNFSVKQDYANDGIWLTTVDTGKTDLIITLDDLIKLSPEQYRSADHKVNHLYYSPSFERFVFLHRWIDKNGKYSRLYCCDRDGNNLKLLLDHRMISHYSWINNDELIVWARTPAYGDGYVVVNVNTGGYYKLDDGSLSAYGDGHPTINSCKNYIVTDTYPDKARMQTLLLFDVINKQKTELGSFLAPWSFDGEKRCDLHPRFKNNGFEISIDSAHENKRKNYILFKA